MPESSPLVFQGVDFACRAKNYGDGCIIEKNNELHVAFQQTDGQRPDLMAVDCPFGTSAEFLDLLKGILPEKKPKDKSYATRMTERVMREMVKDDYSTPCLWDDTARKMYGRKHYFHTTTHIQPTVAMRIVPKCLHWLLEEYGKISGLSGQDFLEQLRKGNGNIIEAHPRMFLYSAIERLYHLTPKIVTREVLYNVADYKERAEKRRFVYGLLQTNQEWMGDFPRKLLPEEPPKELLDSNHAFDAFLSALTAWAHSKNETITWQEAGINGEFVIHEGHFLVLRSIRRQER